MQIDQAPRRTIPPVTLALAAWCILSLLVGLSLWMLYFWKGQAGFDILLPTGPLSRLLLTVLSVVITWLLGGLLLWLLHRGYIVPLNLLTWLGFFLVSFLYLNLLRERLEYGDLDSYIIGATNLYRSQPFDALYIYPPFWAMLLKPLVPHGADAFLGVLWVLNIFALMAFYFLLHRILQRYGFSARLAAIVTTVFLLVNMAVIRTMFYMQVNLLVLDLIFVGILLYPRSRMLSALCLALAVHLKASPLVLVLAFLLERDLRWFAWLAFFGFFIFGVTLLSVGWVPYQSYLHNLSLLNGPRVFNFRETSFDSFFWALAQLLHLLYLFARLGIYLSKALLGIAALLVMFRSVRRQVFYQGPYAGLFNALPPLFILMNMFSPLVWEHHGVFLVLPALVLLRRLSSSTQWLWFGIFYLIQYFIPTFDFFPWSYIRMLTPLLLLWLLWSVSGFSPGESPLFSRFNASLNSLFLTPEVS